MTRFKLFLITHLWDLVYDEILFACAIYDW